MLWEVEIRPTEAEIDREGSRILHEAGLIGIRSLESIRAARLFLLEGELQESDAKRAARELLCDPVVEQFRVRPLPDPTRSNGTAVLNVLFHPGVTDSVGENACRALAGLGLKVDAVATGRRYEVSGQPSDTDLDTLRSRILANDAIEAVHSGPLSLNNLDVGSDYTFELKTVPIRTLDDEGLMTLSSEGQLYLSLAEMQTIRDHFVALDRDPTDIELESVAQTWSEHCSHKTLAGRIHYRELSNDEVTSERRFDNMLKETIFAATSELREQWGSEDWCVSVFKDNAGIVTFDDDLNVCFKVETHNHPSAIEPYGGANTGLGGVIRDPLGTGLGARPVCNTDVFCFAPPETPVDSLPPGVLHPRAVLQGVVSGVRDYGNRMGIPTVNGAVYFDERYLGNPLVYCGNVAMIPRDRCEKEVRPGDYIVALGGRTGRDGIHGATFSSAELTEDSETVSGGAVQIGNAITEKMVHDVLLEARDRGLYNAVTDCGAGGFSSAVGEMGEETGAEVWLEKAPLKYSGLSYTEIWISEAQERMVFSVPEIHWQEFHDLCASEGVEATIIGRFTDTKELVLRYHDQEVGRLTMDFLHDGRPPVIRDAVYHVLPATVSPPAESGPFDHTLKEILGSLNVASKEWIIRQYDHEVQAGSVVKPLTGAENDGPSDAAVVRPELHSTRGLVVSCGMNPHYGDLDPYWMAASAVDEALRNCVATGADPHRIAILDNFCWGNTERPETLGTLVRAAIACYDAALGYQAPFISGKDSLNNEFSYDRDGERTTVAIPSTLLISALGQIDHVEQAVTMDLKSPGNRIGLVGLTADETGGSHLHLVTDRSGGQVPQVDFDRARQTLIQLADCIRQGLIRSCHDLSEGGLAVAAAESAFAGNVGAQLSLEKLPQEGSLPAETLLFAESNSRFLIEVEPQNADNVVSVLNGIPFAWIGETVADQDLTVADADGTIVVSSPLADLKAAWQKPLASL